MLPSWSSNFHLICREVLLWDTLQRCHLDNSWPRKHSSWNYGRKQWPGCVLSRLHESCVAVSFSCYQSSTLGSLTRVDLSSALQLPEIWQRHTCLPFHCPCGLGDGPQCTGEAGPLAV